MNGPGHRAGQVRHRLPLVPAFFLLLLFLCACGTRDPAQSHLLADRKGAFVGGEELSLRFEVAQRDPVVIRFEEIGVDAELHLSGPGDFKSVATNATKRRGDITLALPVPASGGYELRVKTVQRSVPGGRYELRVLQLPNGANRDATAPYALSSNAHEALARASSTDWAQAGAYLEKVEAFWRERSRSDQREDRTILLDRPIEEEAHAALESASIALWHTYDWDVAIAASRRARKLFEELNDDDGHDHAMMIEGAALIEVAGQVRRSNQREESAKLLEEAEERLRTVSAAFEQRGALYEAARAHNFRGVCHREQGRYEDAVTALALAAQTFEKLAERPSQYMALQNLATIRGELGEYREALRQWDEIMPQIEFVSDPQSVADATYNSALALSATGDPEAALDRFLRAHDLLGKVSDSAGQARALQALGTVYSRLGEPERALDYYAQALKIRRELGEARGLNSNLVAAGNVHRSLGDMEQALALHKEAVDHARSAYQQARTSLALGEDLLALRKWAQSTQHLDRVAESGLPQGHPFLVQAQIAKARLLRLSGKPGEAIRVIDAASQVTRGEYLPHEASLLLHERSLSRRDLDQIDAAVTEVTKAIGLHETLRARALNPDLRASILAVRRDYYHTLVELLMRAGEKTEPERKDELTVAALLAADQSRARSLEDMLSALPAAHEGDEASSAELLDDQLAAKLHRLDLALERASTNEQLISSLQNDVALLRARVDSASRMPGVAGAKPAARSLDAKALASIQKRLGHEQAIVEFSLGDTRSWAWIITNASVDVRSLPSEREFASATRTLAALLHAPGSAQRLEAAKQKLRDLVEPVLTSLDSRTSLALVLDGPLHDIPPPLLLSFDDRQPVTTLVLPSLGVLLLDLGKASLNDTHAGSVVVVASDPSLSRLPGARSELQSIAGLAGPRNFHLLQGPALARSSLVKFDFRRYGILHVSAHATASAQDARLSAIHIQAGPGSALTYDLRVSDIRRHSMASDLVVLAACETARGKAFAGEGVVGLAHAFLTARASRVVASLWKVPDAATSQMMARFYAALLKEGFSPEAALARAQSQMQEQPQWRDPYYWAGFVVMARTL